MAEGSPTVRRRRLGLLLRDLRDGRGLTGEQVGEAIERSASWISRVETGRIGLRLRDLRDLLDLYEVHEPETRQELEALAREGRQRGWWSKYSESLSEPYQTYIGYEAEATALRFYQNILVPGLLQTEEYARAVIQGGLISPSERAAEDLVRVRMERQALLHRENPPEVMSLVEEAVLHNSLGREDVLKPQLEHLVRMAHDGRVKIRIVPLDKNSPTAPTASFVIMSFLPADPKIVYVETLGGGTFEDGEHATAYQALYQSLLDTSLGESDSIERIRHICAALP